MSDDVVKYFGPKIAKQGHRGTRPPGVSAFAYLYDDGELAEWISPVRRLEEEVHEVHVLFSNCHRDQAVTNARRPSGRSTRRIRRLG